MAASLVSIIATPPAHAFIKPRFPTHSFVSFIPWSFFRPQFCLNSRSVLFPLELLKFEVLQTPSSASSCFDCCRSRSCVHRTRTSSLLQTPGFLLLLKKCSPRSMCVRHRGSLLSSSSSPRRSSVATFLNFSVIFLVKWFICRTYVFVLFPIVRSNSGGHRPRHYCQLLLLCLPRCLRRWYCIHLDIPSCSVSNCVPPYYCLVFSRSPILEDTSPSRLPVENGKWNLIIFVACQVFLRELRIAYCRL